MITNADSVGNFRPTTLTVPTRRAANTSTPTPVLSSDRVAHYDFNFALSTRPPSSNAKELSNLRPRNRARLRTRLLHHQLRRAPALARAVRLRPPRVRRTGRASQARAGLRRPAAGPPARLW